MGIVSIAVPGYASIFAAGGTTQAIVGTGNYVLPAGWYYIKTDANSKVQIITTGSTWTDLPAGAAGTLSPPIYSDGTNMRILSTAGGGASPVLYRIG